MKNKFGRLTESRKLEMLQMTVEEIYNAGYDAGELAGKLELVEKVLHPKSPNQRRAELIQRAKDFIKKYGKEYGFIKQDNLVVAIHKKYDGKKNGYACCREGDVFNFWIGKAIALARALEIEVPGEFMDCVQPDEVVVGMRIECTLEDNPYIFGKVFNVGERGSYSLHGNHCAVDSRNGKSGRIIDDTNAQYNEVTA